ncbi:MAG: CsiV family protein [Pseudomonadales bacterium]
MRRPNYGFLKVRAAFATIALALPFSITAEPQQGSWYQIEVIAFKRLAVAEDQPTAAPAPQPYPPTLVAIAPSANSPTRPQRIEQAMYLSAENTLSPRLASKASAEAQVDFRFADLALGPKNRALLTAVKAQQSEQADLTGEPDLISLSAERARSEALTALFERPSPAFRAVADEDRMLGGAARSIRRSSLYRILLHQSWTQPITGEETAILLQGGQQYGAAFELEGTLSVRKNRFLHIKTDLWFVRFGKTLTQQQDWSSHPLNSDFPALIKAAINGETFAAGNRYQMTEQRRLRSNEAHYLDHPQFGLIVQIRPVDPNAI